MSYPCIGDILALSITLETGDIGRFKKVGNFAPKPDSLTKKTRQVRQVRIDYAKMFIHKRSAGSLFEPRDVHR